jgi:bacteriorhodopsin
MLFTIFVTVFTAFVIKVPLDRNIIILEALISTISTTIYYFLDKKIEASIENNEPIDWKGMAILRYRGWTFSTPLMIIGFLLFLSSTTKIALNTTTAISCILLDWLMIFIG